MIYYDDGYQLLPKCFIRLLEYMKCVGEADDSIYYPLISQMVSFLPRLTLKLHKNARFVAPSLNGKWHDYLQGEAYISAEVFHNLSLM